MRRLFSKPIACATPACGAIWICERQASSLAKRLLRAQREDRRNQGLMFAERVRKMLCCAHSEHEALHQAANVGRGLAALEAGGGRARRVESGDRIVRRIADAAVRVDCD